MKYIVSFLLSFLMFSAVAQTKTKTETVKEPLCKIQISFGSPGSGIDAKTYDAVIKMIKDNKLKYSEKSHGKEGETTICLPLTELKKSKKTEFIKQLKNTATAGQFVSVSEK